MCNTYNIVGFRPFLCVILAIMKFYVMYFLINDLIEVNYFFLKHSTLIHPKNAQNVELVGLTFARFMYEPFYVSSV